MKKEVLTYMGYVMKQNLARKENYGSERSTAEIFSHSLYFK